MDLFNNTTFPLGFGTARLRSINGGLSARSARYLLQSAFDLGIRFFDTAPSYGQGQSETAIGLLPRRVTDAMLICSKVGYSYGRKAMIINALKPFLRPAASSVSFLRQLAHKSRARMLHQGSLGLDIQPAVIRASLAGTLRRLRRDRLDLLLLHDPGVAFL